MITFDHTLDAVTFNALRAAVDWAPIELEQAEKGLLGSDYLVVARDGDRPVGMVRTLSDGGYFVFVVDVIVLPEYQGQKLGTALINNVLEHYRSTLKEGQKISVNLMAVKDKDGFYQKLGFTSRPNENAGSGMTLYLYPERN